MIVRMNGLLAGNGCSCQLTTAVGDDLVYVHIELCAASRHPYVQGKLTPVLARQDFIAGPNDQILLRAVQVSERSVGKHKLFGKEIVANVEKLQRTLGLRSP